MFFVLLTTIFTHFYDLWYIRFLKRVGCKDLVEDTSPGGLAGDAGVELGADEKERPPEEEINRCSGGVIFWRGSGEDSPKQLFAISSIR